jgi:hypothetical protein
MNNKQRPQQHPQTQFSGSQYNVLQGKNLNFGSTYFKTKQGFNTKYAFNALPGKVSPFNRSGFNQRKINKLKWQMLKQEKRWKQSGRRPRAPLVTTRYIIDNFRTYCLPQLIRERQH